MFTNWHYADCGGGVTAFVQVPSSNEDIKVHGNQLITDKVGLLPQVAFLNQRRNVNLGFSPDRRCSRRGRCPNFGHYHVVMDGWAYAGQTVLNVGLTCTMRLGNDVKTEEIPMRFEKVIDPWAIDEFIRSLRVPPKL